MRSTFLTHQWKAFWRSRNKTGSILAQLFFGFFVFYFLVAAIGVGFMMSALIEKISPEADPVVIFNGFILYYFLIDLTIRVQMQELPTLSVVPYLHLNISRKKIVNFLNLRSLFSIFNVLPWFIFFPFVIVNIGGQQGTTIVLAYLLSIVGLVAFNHFLVLYIKRKAINNILIFGVGFFIILALAGLDFYGVISIRDFSNLVFKTLAHYPYLCLVFFFAAFAIYKINSNFLSANLYTEELSTKNAKKVSTDYPFLNSFGRVGELAALELKLILRHKRSRSSLMMGILFLAYGFLFYKKELLATDEFGKMLFAAIFMTGISIVNYGQFMFAWQSVHFDGLLVNKIDFKNFIKAKFLLLTISCTIITVLSSFYGFISYKLLLLHLVAYLYNIGFGVVVILFFATNNYKRLDITQSATFNWQGVGATQWILGLPFALVPVILYLPFGIMDKPYFGLLSIGIFGLITLLLRNYWVAMIVKRFERKRYQIAEGFRE